MSRDTDNMSLSERLAYYRRCAADLRVLSLAMKDPQALADAKETIAEYQALIAGLENLNAKGGTE